MGVLRSDSPVQYVKGVGPQRSAWLETLGIRTVGELLEYYPFRYEQDRGEVDIADVVLDAMATVRGTVVHMGGRPPTIRCEIEDGTGSCVLRWFNRPPGGLRLFRGATVIATGRVRLYDDLPELVQPTVQVLPADALVVPSQEGPRSVGVYRGNSKVGSALVRRVVGAVLAQGRLPVDDPLPAALLARHRFPEREEAVRQMHAPSGSAQLEQARRRLAYEELFLMELALALRRRKRLSLQAGQNLHATAEIDRHIRRRFPFSLTAGQDEAVREIVEDLQSGRPMTRLLQGDVGSGKTVVALYACLVAVAGGRQAAIMAPTEVLAHQHFHNIERYLEGSRVRYVLLRGRMGRRERAEALAKIENGEIDLVVGTQALIQKDVAFNQLALVVVDEQHKFGVLQRHEFRTKGPMPHYLVMTATPIPRTLAMTVFGDLDVSIIRQMPPGRGRVITKVVTARQWDTVMTYVRRRLEAGEQGYVVCPQIGEDEGGESPDDADETKSKGRGAGRSIATVKETFEKLMNGPWQGLEVGWLHGGLPSAQKQAVVSAFEKGELRAVVSTTVVEVGVDVPNATIMIVEHADRYGLSQLHQLRGRVGRGSKDSLCVLIARDQGGKSGERLSVMAETTDGFRIAEADLRQRGPGELFGTKQHGLPELRVASIVDDLSLLEQARRDAFALAAVDAGLERAEHAGLRAGLRRMLGGRLALIDAG